MNNTNIQTKLNSFNTLLTKALQQHNQTIFSLSVGTLLEIQDLMFPTSQTSPTEASTELLSETSSGQTTDQTSEQNITKESN